MLRFCAIGLFFIYLVSFTEFKEVLRFPLLVQHYAEHKDQVAEMSFLEFLVMHYKTDEAHDDRDNRLPFKDSSHSFIGQLVVLPIQKISLVEQIETTETSYQFFYFQHEPKLIAADIFQPPKV
ncbi:MAG: hypothetical protein KBF45_09385 [Cyclobacteriaceae bacterium]|jgi:hypothetical protein|nr:hypothetical protein [Cyclobacteriaceae bacterium]